MGNFLKKIYRKNGVGINREISLNSLIFPITILENIIKDNSYIEYGCNRCNGNGYIFIDKKNNEFGKMSIICDCAINTDNINKAFELWKKSNIPKNLIIRYRLDNWEKVNETDINIILDIFKNIGNKNWVYIHGSAGVGKTYLSILIAKIALLKELSVFYIKTVDLLDRLRPNGDENSNELMNRCKNAGFLILDDIGHEKVSEWVRERIFSLISSRWDNGLITIFTSNFGVENIKDKISEAVYSRIKGESYIINMSGKDRRLN